jgi:hypothetical protein
LSTSILLSFINILQQTARFSVGISPCLDGEAIEKKFNNYLLLYPSSAHQGGGKLWVPCKKIAGEKNQSSVYKQEEYQVKMDPGILIKSMFQSNKSSSYTMRDSAKMQFIARYYCMYAMNIIKDALHDNLEV